MEHAEITRTTRQEHTMDTSTSTERTATQSPSAPQGAALEAMLQDIAAWRRRFRKRTPWTPDEIEDFAISCGWSAVAFPDDLEDYDTAGDGMWRPKEATKALMRERFASSDLDHDGRVAAWRRELGLEPETAEQFAALVRQRNEAFRAERAAWHEAQRAYEQSPEYLARRAAQEARDEARWLRETWTDVHEPWEA